GLRTRPGRGRLGGGRRSTVDRTQIGRALLDLLVGGEREGKAFKIAPTLVHDLRLPIAAPDGKRVRLQLRRRGNPGEPGRRLTECALLTFVPGELDRVSRCIGAHHHRFVYQNLRVENVVPDFFAHAVSQRLSGAELKRKHTPHESYGS